MQLRKSQKDAIAFAKQQQGTLLWHGMGAGKTRTTIGIAEDQNAKKILIVTLKSVIPVWQQEFDKCLPNWQDNYIILSFDKKSMSVAKKAELLKKQIKFSKLRNKKLVVVINYESLWRKPLGITYHFNSKAIKDRGVILNTEWDLVVVDECQKISASGSTISKFMHKLHAKSKLRVALSGTPCSNGPLDCYGIFRFLNPDIFGTNFFMFKTKYAIYGGFEQRQIISYQNMHDYNEKFHAITHRVKTEDVVELPQYSHIQVPITLSTKAMKLYKELNKEMILTIEEGKMTPANILVKNLRLAQITSGILVLDSGEKKVVDTSKLDTLIDLIKSLPPKEPIVVFTKFKPEVTQIKQAVLALKYTDKNDCVQAYQVSELTGSVNTLAAWQAGKTDVLIANLDSGGAGVDLTRSRYCFYFSKSYSNQKYEQSLARTRRPGADLTKKLFYYHLYAKDTIDQLIMYAITHKQKIIDTLVEYYTKK